MKVSGAQLGMAAVCFTTGVAIAVSSQAQISVAAPVEQQSDTTPVSEGQAAAEPSGGSDIVVTGSRFGGRTRIGSATPVDAISQEELQQSGRVDLIQMLKVQVPSFSSPRPLASGIGDFLQPPSLRGLGPGELLVLINGKRRHTSSDLNSSNGIGRGDVSIDFNAIPSLALSRIEVLRDGAAAQYGSDAISGVINMFLDRSVGTRARQGHGRRPELEGKDAKAAHLTNVGEGGAVRLSPWLRPSGQVPAICECPMPLYFFHSHGGAEFIDEVGTELPNDARAYGEAVRLAGAMLRDDPQLLFAGRPFRTEVVSEAGECLFTIMAQALPGAVSQAV